MLSILFFMIIHEKSELVKNLKEDFVIFIKDKLYYFMIFTKLKQQDRKNKTAILQILQNSGPFSY